MYQKKTRSQLDSFCTVKLKIEIDHVFHTKIKN